MDHWITYLQPPCRGLSHLQDDRPCQDASCAGEDDHIAVIALSDGVGSLEYSEFAAQSVTQAVTDYFLAHSQDAFLHMDPLKEELLSVCQKAVQEQQRQHKSADGRPTMDCTLLFAAVLKDSKRFLCGQLGDGAICLFYPTLARMHKSHQSAYAGITHTVMSANAAKYLSLQSDDLNDLQGFLMASDGLEGDFYDPLDGVLKVSEQYFNLIAADRRQAPREIADYWENTLHRYPARFSDDFSLAALLIQDARIDLPDDPTWLCACGHRNPLQSSQCPHCARTFLSIYQGDAAKFDASSKAVFFRELNQDPAREAALLHLLLQEKPAPGVSSSTSVPQRSPETTPQEPDTPKTAPQEPDTPRAIPQEPPKSAPWDLPDPSPVSTPADISASDFSDIQRSEYDLSYGRSRRSSSHFGRMNSSLKFFSLTLTVLLLLSCAFTFSYKQRLDTLNAKYAALQTEYADAARYLRSFPSCYTLSQRQNGIPFIGFTDEDRSQGAGAFFYDNQLIMGSFKDHQSQGDYYILAPDGTITHLFYLNGKPVPVPETVPEEVPQDNTSQDEALPPPAETQTPAETTPPTEQTKPSDDSAVSDRPSAPDSVVDPDMQAPSSQPSGPALQQPQPEQDPHLPAPSPNQPPEAAIPPAE